MVVSNGRYNAYLKRLLTRVEAGALSPINMHIFEGLEEGARSTVLHGMGMAAMAAMAEDDLPPILWER